MAVPEISLAPAPSRPYFSQRRGRGPASTRLDVVAARRLIFSTLDELVGADLFAEAVGHHCVDDGLLPGIFGHDADAFFIRRIGRPGVWPYREGDHLYDLDTLCDVIETLYDVVSWPIEGSFHSFAGCGWHYSHFDRKRGQKAMRERLNPVLERIDPPMQLNSDGEIVEIGEPGFERILSAELPIDADPEVASRVTSALRTVRDRHADADGMRLAVRDLADALEFVRPRVKQEMLPKDERDLFHLANGFSIRHLNRDQRGQYDQRTWLRWAFYVYLATIHAIIRVSGSQAAAQPRESS